MTCSQEDALAVDRALLARAAAWVDCPALHDCAGSQIATIVREQGMAFATALLYDRVLRCSGNAAFFQQVAASRCPVVNDPPLVAIIPGAFYLEHSNTGANGAQLASILASLNCRVERVPVESFGSLTRNAAIITDWLSRHRRERVAFISLSKGSADLKVALGLPNSTDLFRNVGVWISLSGLSEGTPLVAWLRRRPWRNLGVRLLLRLRGQRYSVVEELRHEPGGPLTIWPSVPAHLRLVHILGFPLRRHLVHPWASRGFDRVAPLGPNDGGGFLLSDATKLPGTVFPVWGADHYLQPVWDVTALLRRIFVEALSPPSDPRQAI